MKFIGKMLLIKSVKVEVKYFRRSTKAMNVYVFPNIEDMTVNITQILEEVKPLSVSRGRYIFPYEMD